MDNDIDISTETMSDLSENEVLPIADTIKPARDGDGDGDGDGDDKAGDNNTTDAAGVTFDNNLHMTDTSGKPKLTKNGNFRKKTKRQINADDKYINRGEPSPDDILKANNKAAAIVISRIIEQGQVVLFSDGFTYADAERDNNISAWDRYFMSKGGVEISPLAELSLSHGAIILTRLNNEKVIKNAGKIKTLFKKIKGKMFNNKKKETSIDKKIEPEQS